MPLLRRAIANGFASVAVALFSLAAPGASAQAKAGAAIHAGPIGGITLPSAPGSSVAHHSLLADAELYGGGAGSAGTSPGGGTPPLLYGGGPVMHGVTAQVVAWAPSAYPFPSGYVSGYEQYLADMSTGLGLSSNISSVAAQYVDAGGAALSSLTNNGAITDTDAYPTSGGCTVSGAVVCLTEGQILTELSSVISAHALPVDESHSYIVLLPPSVDTCFDSSSGDCETQAFCGYHTAFTIGSSTTTFTLLPYTASTYSNAAGQCYVSGGPSGLSAAVNAVDSIGAHELFESATDPLVGSGYVDSTGEEIGDECAWTWGSTGSASGGGAYNQLVNSHQYLIQEMWSNQAGHCEQGASSTAHATISSAGSPVLNTATSFSVALSGDSSAASSYEWSYLAPNGSQSSDVSTSASPSLTFTRSGTYTVWVAVTDTAGGTVTAVKSVTVASTPPPPTVSFTDSTTAAADTPGTAISFSSSANAGSGSITGYSWSFGDGTSSTSSSPSHTYASAGSYTVTLTVTETGGITANVTHTLSVTKPPSAAIGWSPSAVTAGSSVTFSAGASAGAGSISAYSWNFGDGSSSTAGAPSHTYSATGTHTVKLTVTQSNGLATTVTKSLTVAAAVVPPPTVSFSETTTAPAPTPSAPINFISSAVAGSGTITAYNWNFGNGATSNVADPSHTFLNAGTYTVTLTVTQTGGLTASKTATVVVAAPPHASFSWSTAHTLYPGTAITFKPTVSAGAGTITAYSWNFADGSSSTATSPTHSFARSNSYNVTLTVTQSDGLTTTAQKTVLIAQPLPTASTSTSSSSSKSSTSSSSIQWSPPSSWLVQTIQTASTATKIGDLLRANGSKAILSAPRASGKLVITWRATERHHSVVIARSRGYVLAGVTPNVAIRLTRTGRRLLSRKRQIKVAAQATFRSASSASRTTRRLTLTR
jgi:PKD repeat protein